MYVSFLRTAFQFLLVLEVLWMQALLAFKARRLGGLISQVQVLKIVVPVVEFKLISPQGESPGLSPIGGYCGGGVRIMMRFLLTLL